MFNNYQNNYVPLANFVLLIIVLIIQFRMECFNIQCPGHGEKKSF